MMKSPSCADDANLDSIVSTLVDMLDAEEAIPSAPFTVSSNDVSSVPSYDGVRPLGPARGHTTPLPSIDLSALGAAQLKGAVVLVNNLEPKTTHRALLDVFFPMGAAEAEVLPANGARRRTGLVVFPTRDMAIMAAQKMNDFVPHGQSQPLHAVYVPAGAGQNRTPTTVREMIELRGSRLDPAELAVMLVAEDGRPQDALAAIQEALCVAHDTALVAPFVEAFRHYVAALPVDAPKTLLRDISRWVFQTIMNPREDAELRGTCGALCALLFHTGLIAGSPFDLALRLLNEASASPRQTDEGLIAALNALRSVWYRHNEGRPPPPSAVEFAAALAAYVERSASVSASDASLSSSTAGGNHDRSGASVRSPMARHTQASGSSAANSRRAHGGGRDSLACTVYITKVPPSIPHEQLGAFFRAFGEYVKVRLYVDGDGGHAPAYRSCFGFVQFLRASAARAIVDYCRNASTTPPATPNTSTGSTSSTTDAAMAEVVRRTVPRAQLQLLHVMRVSFARSCIHDQDPTDAVIDPNTHVVTHPCTFGV